jgi:hypothetical protein
MVKPTRVTAVLAVAASMSLLPLATSPAGAASGAPRPTVTAPATVKSVTPLGAHPMGEPWCC